MRSRSIDLRTALFGALLTTPFLLWSTESIAQNRDEAAADGGHAHEHTHDEHGETEEIVVTASPLEHDRDELSVLVDRVDRDEILENLGSTLGDSLSHIPGLASTGFSAGASRPVIRGQDAYRTEVLEDGLQTQDVSRESPDHAVPVNPLVAERVEIVRGPATLRYGGGASAGVVNVITNRVPDRIPAENLQGEIFAGVGLVANERDLAASLDAGKGEFAWHADGLFRRSNDYSIPNDATPHIQSGSQVDSWMGALGGAYLFERGRVGASYTRAENTYGIPQLDEAVEIDMHTDRFRFEGDLLNPAPGLREIRVRGVYSDYEHDEIADDVVGQTYRNKEFEGRLEALHETLFGVTGALGIHARHRDFRGEGEAAEFLAPAKTSMAAVYLTEELPVTDEITFEAGIRIEHTRVEGVDAADLHRDLDFTPVSGALGVTVTPTDWLTIGLNASASQRAPSQVELLARGTHEATRTFEIGDPSLDEETSFAGDFRIQIEVDRGRVEWATFITQYDDFIFAGLTGISVDETGAVVAPTDPEALDQLRYGNRDILFWGTELLGEFDLLQLDFGAFGIDGRFDFVRARFDSGDVNGSRNAPRIVPMRFGSSLYFRGEALDARVGFAHTQAQDKIGDFETSTNGFTHLNASLGYRVDLIDDVPLELSVVARNLNDVRGRNHIAFNKDEVLLPGRSIRFALRAQF